jgi:hypothetical protein
LSPQQWARSPSLLGCRWFIRRPPASHCRSQSHEQCNPTHTGSQRCECYRIGTRWQALSFFGYESLQAKAYNGSRYDCARSNRRRSHTRAGNMGVAEGQNARSSDYRRSTRLTRTEVTPSLVTRPLCLRRQLRRP